MKMIQMMNKTVSNLSFDYIVQNPPYAKSTHLEFLQKGIELIKASKGKMRIVEPASWLLNIRNNGKAKSEYSAIKSLLDKHVSKVIVENYNAEFNVGLSIPCSITYIDFSREFESIIYICCGHSQSVSSLNDCNLIGSYAIISSIFEKISKYDKMKNHIYDNKGYDSSTRFVAIAKVMRGGIGDPRLSDEWFINNHYRCYYYHCFNDKEEISATPHKFLCTGYTYENPKYKDENCLNICGTQSELENFKYFVFNSQLCLFLNICIILDMNTNCISEYVPWLVDKKYSDDEINKLFEFTNEEIKLMHNTIKKFDRYSPWFKRYMIGKNVTTNEEIQNFIEKLKG